MYHARLCRRKKWIQEEMLHGPSIRRGETRNGHGEDMENKILFIREKSSVGIHNASFQAHGASILCMNNTGLLRMPDASSPHHICAECVLDTILVNCPFTFLVVIERMKQASLLDACTELVFATTKHRYADGSLSRLPAVKNRQRLLQHACPCQTAGKVQGNVARLVAEAWLQAEQWVYGA